MSKAGGSSKGGRPRKLGDQKQITIRFPQDMLDKIDRYRARHEAQLSKALPGAKVTKADAVRALVTIALDHVESRRKR